MSCGCPPTIATSNLLPVIYDPVTKQVRPLAFGEKLPDGMCKNCERANAMALPTKQLQDAYYGLYQRLIKLEEKYCNCICPPSETPTPFPECPDPVPCPEPTPCPECPDCPDCPEPVIECVNSLRWTNILDEAGISYFDPPEDFEYNNHNYGRQLVLNTPAYVDPAASKVFQIVGTDGVAKALPAGYSLSVTEQTGEFVDSTITITWDAASTSYKTYIGPVDESLYATGHVLITLSREGVETPCDTLEIIVEGW